MEYILQNYQKELSYNIQNRDSLLVTLDMGSGKTLSTLDAITVLKGLDVISKPILLISFPIILNGWEDEIKKFDFDLSINIINGTPKKRLEQLVNNKSDIIGVSIYNIKWFVENNPYYFDMMVLDESSTIKNFSSQRFKMLKRFINSQDKSIRKLLLTGTPTPNGYINLWTQIYILDRGLRLGRDISTFRRRYMKPHPYIKYKYDEVEGMETIIKQKVKDLTFNIDKSLLPQHIINYKYIEHSLTKNVLATIDNMKKEFIMSIEGVDDEESLIANGAILYIKMQQIASGGLLVGEEYKHLHNNRINKLSELLESYENENFIIVYSYKFQRDLILKHIKNVTLWDKTKGNSIKNAWNSGKIKYLLAHHGNLSHGLNLQYGGSNIVYFNPIDNLENYLQLNKRLARGRDSKIVNIYHLWSTPEDLKIYKSLENKELKLNDMLKSFIKQLR
jgi:superfamily II DNA or RNA helicase